MDSSRSEVADPLTGFTVGGVTAARRAEELITLLERRGAAVVHAPTIRIVPLVDDVELHRVTEQLIAEPPDLVVVTTGIGFRGWVEAAHGWGGRARRVARGTGGVDRASWPVARRPVARFARPGCARSGARSRNRRWKCWNGCCPRAWTSCASRCNCMVPPANGNPTPTSVTR